MPGRRHGREARLGLPSGAGSKECSRAAEDLALAAEHADH